MAGQPTAAVSARFVAAVKCMNGGGDIKQANEWLMSFTTMDAAWAVTMQCLFQREIPTIGSAEELDFLHFHAANILKDKIRRSGESLPPPARVKLRQRLVQLINGYHAKGSTTVARQLCIGLANLAVVDDQWNDVILSCARGFSALSQREMLLDVLKYVFKKCCRRPSTHACVRAFGLEGACVRVRHSPIYRCAGF